MSDMTAPEGEAPASADGTEQAATTEQPGIDQYQERLDQRLEELTKSIPDLIAQSMQQYQQPQDIEDDDPWPLTPEDDGFEEQEAQRLIDEMVNERVQQALTPFQQQQNQRQIQQDYAQLQTKYPELQDEKVSAPIIEAVANMADSLGFDINNPGVVGLIEQFYKATVADKHAQQETPAGGRRDVQLESGGGAAPVDREEDLQDRMSKNAPVSANYLI